MASFIVTNSAKLLPSASTASKHSRFSPFLADLTTKTLVSFSSSIRASSINSVTSRNVQSSVVVAAGPRHLMGSLTKTEGLRFAVQRYMMCMSFVDNGLTSFRSSLHKFSPVKYSLRPITTGGSVNEQVLAGDFESFLSALKDKTLSTKEICSNYIERLIRSDNLMDAVYCFSYLHNSQIHLGLDTYNILLNAAGEENSFDHFAAIFKKLLLSRLTPDFTSYVHVAKAFQNLSDSNLILKFIRDLAQITTDRSPIVMNRIIFVTAKSGQLDKSLIIFEELKKLEGRMDTVTFNTVLVMLGRAGRFEQMLHEFNVMKDSGFTPNIITYNTLINCLRRLGRLDLCKSFATEMVEKGIELDLRTYTALIDVFGRAGHVDDASRLFDEMKRSQRPSFYVYRAMISNLKKSGRFEAAIRLSEEMKSSTLKLVGPEDFKRENKRNKMRLRGSRQSALCDEFLN